MSGTPPVIPAELLPYNSYEEDPKYARAFTYTWVSAVGLCVLLYLPRFIRAMQSGRAFSGIFGVKEDWGYHAVPNNTPTPVPMKQRSTLMGAMGRIRSMLYWTLPGIELNLGQILIVASYFTLSTVLTTLSVPLTENSNRAGFVALASFPPLFLLGTKNSILTFVLPGNGYEKLNYLHRWSARIMFLGILVHGSLWINDHLHWKMPIIGLYKETTGMAAFGVLCCIILTGWRTLRRARWEVFWVVHMLGFPAFFITVCYHTIYAAPWIYPPLAFYGFDLILRMIKFRVKDAILIPVDEQMTLIQIPHATSSFSAGQHLRLRVFFTSPPSTSGKTGLSALVSKLSVIFPSMHFIESHPLTIINAPSHVTCITNPNDQGILLGARVSGDWGKALNAYALAEGANISSQKGQDEKPPESSSSSGAIASSSSCEPPLVRALVTISGPYSPTSIDLGQYENVLLFAGGSGATFTLSLLDDIVGRCVRLGRQGGERTRRIEFGWCIRSFGALRWFAGYLEQIATMVARSRTPTTHEGDSIPLDLHISVYVTCLCNPEAIPPIPNCDVMIVRPDMYAVLRDLLTPPPCPSESIDRRRCPPQRLQADESLPSPLSSKLPWVALGGGVAVCASGPETMTREASNAVARLQMSSRGRGLGSVGLCTELFAI